MSKGNILYSVVAYVGGLESRETRVLFRSTKESEAEAYLYGYMDTHPELTKVYIERTYVRKYDKRRFIDND